MGVMKILDEEDIEQIELILEIEYKDIGSAHVQQYLKLLYEIYKEQINGTTSS
jgi:hypothetical protein